jgi:hypothetical protein
VNETGGDETNPHFPPHPPNGKLKLFTHRPSGVLKVAPTGVGKTMFGLALTNVDRHRPRLFALAGPATDSSDAQALADETARIGMVPPTFFAFSKECRLLITVRISPRRSRDGVSVTRLLLAIE